MTAALRGQIYWFDMGHGEKPWVVVSNNVRNRNLNTVLAARVTTTPKPGVPTAVPLGAADPLVGSILADDLIQLFDDELAASRPAGALSPATVVKLNKALAIALGLPCRTRCPTVPLDGKGREPQSWQAAGTVTGR